MATDLDLASAIAALYQPSPPGFDAVEETGGIVWGLKHLTDADLVVARGAVTIEDYAREAVSELARALPGYPALGLLPLGFSEGLVPAYSTIAGVLRPDYPSIFAGHSLGAVHASGLAALHLVHEGSVVRLMLCGTPRPGMAALARLLGGVPVASYRNRGDPVPGTPVPIPKLLPWCHLRTPFVPLCEPPARGDDGPFCCHRWDLYQAGITALATPPGLLR